MGDFEARGWHGLGISLGLVLGVLKLEFWLEFSFKNSLPQLELPSKTLPLERSLFERIFSKSDRIQRVTTFKFSQHFKTQHTSKTPTSAKEGSRPTPREKLEF